MMFFYPCSFPIVVFFFTLIAVKTWRIAFEIFYFLKSNSISVTIFPVIIFYDSIFAATDIASDFVMLRFI